jgi:hypothetical protein
VKFAGMPTESIACVAAARCDSQYENAAAFTNNRIISVYALVRNLDSCFRPGKQRLSRKAGRSHQRILVPFPGKTVRKPTQLEFTERKRVAQSNQMFSPETSKALREEPRPGRAVTSGALG